MPIPKQTGSRSRMTVSELISAHVPTDPAAPSDQTRASRERAYSQAGRNVARRPLLRWLTLGGCAAIFVAVLTTALVLSKPSDKLSQNDLTAAVSEAVTIPASPTASTGVHATEAPVVATLASLPTVKYPDGNLFKIFYDDNSLYLLNLSKSTIPINWIAFERLSDADAALNRFNGTRWAEFYSNSVPGRCMALRILGSSDYLDPPECGNNNFLSLRTPTRDDPVIFWTTMDGSHQFRVLWREGGEDEEIARCEIGAGTCEVFLP
jgi:hypothetical protein